MKKKNIDIMLLATFLTTLFYSSTHPYIHKCIIMGVSNEHIAVSQIINCISIVIFGSLWNKYSDKLFQYYHLFCIGETLLGVLSTIFAIITKNIVSYYILDTLIFSIVTRNICCGGVKLKAIRYNSEELREKFDNNNNSASAIATILGSLMAIKLNLNFEIMLCIATIGNAIDNIFYIIIFNNVKKRSI